MKTMQALLWKEAREHSLKIAVGIGICLAIFLFRHLPTFDKGLMELLGVALTLPGLLIAFFLALDVVSGERERGTIDFLLSRPVPSVRILASKMIVGMAGFVLVLGAFLGLFYLMPLEGYAGDILAAVPFSAMLLLWTAHFLPVYAFAFLGSALTDRPVKGIAAGLFIYLAVVAVLGGLGILHPEFGHLLDRYGGHGFDRSGRILSIYRYPSLVLGRVVLAGAVAGIALALGTLSLKKVEEWKLSWRTVLIGWTIALMGALLVASSSSYDQLVKRVARFYPFDSMEESHIEPVCVWKEDEKLIKPVEGWSLLQLAESGSRLYALGAQDLPEGAVDYPGARKPGIIVFDISNPRQPQVISRQVIGDPAGSAFPGESVQDVFNPIPGPDGLSFDPGRVFPWWGMIAARGDELFTLLFVTTGDGRPEDPGRLIIQAFSMDGDGKAGKLDELVIGGNDSAIRLVSGSGMGLDVELIGSFAYISLREGVVMVDLGKPDDLREAGLLKLDNVTKGYGRGMTRRDEKLYVERLWPHELVEFDISNPARPVEVGQRWKGDRIHRFPFAFARWLDSREFVHVLFPHRENAKRRKDTAMGDWLIGTKRGLYRGEIGGEWHQVGGYTFRVTSILRDAGKVCVGVGSGLWEVDFEGIWKQLHDETLTEVLAIDAVPGDPGVVAASAYGVATGERDELGAARWTFWSDGLAVDERFSNAILVGGEGRWLVGTEAGVLVAEDKGRKWTHTSLIGSPVRGLCRALGGFWAGTDERGIWRSADGFHWEQAGTGLDGGTVFDLVESGERIVAGTLEGVVVGDGKGHWQRVGPRMLMAAVGADPGNPEVWLAGGDPGSLWLTEDEGQKWQQVAGLPTAIEAILAPEEG